MNIYTYIITYILYILYIFTCVCVCVSVCVSVCAILLIHRCIFITQQVHAITSLSSIK